MAIRWAAQNGGWSSTSTWDGGTLPAIDDDVFADGRLITIDQSITAFSLRTSTTPRVGGNAGGNFFATNGITITSSLTSGTTTVLIFNSAAPNFFTLVGNISSGSGIGLLNNGSGTIDCFGDVHSLGGTGIFNNSNGRINLRGSLNKPGTGGGIINNISTSMFFMTGFIYEATSGGNLVQFTNNGYFNLSGNATGGSGTSNGTEAILNNSICDVTGFIRGGAAANGSIGIENFGRVNLVGFVQGGPNSIGIRNATTNAVLYVTGGIIGQPNTNDGFTVYQEGITNFVYISGFIEGGTGGGNPRSGVYQGNLISTGPTVIRGGNGVNGPGYLDFRFLDGPFIVNITGQVIGGPGGAGIRLTRSNTTVIINGTVRGGTTAAGISNEQTSPVSAFQAIGGGVAGINNTSNGTVIVKKAIGAPGGPLNSTGGTGPAITNSQNGLAYAEEVEFGDQGATPISGPVFISPSPTNIFSMRRAPSEGTNPDGSFLRVPFFNSFNIEGIFPAVRDVRKGVVYALGDFTGTMAVPSPSAVQFDVPVDDTKGQLFLKPENFWDIPRQNLNDPTTIGYRLKNMATTAAIGQMIGSFNLGTLSGYDTNLDTPLVTQYIYYRGENQIDNFKWRTAYLVVSSSVTKFSVLVNGLSDIDFYNYFDRTNFSNCFWTLTTTPALSANRRILRPSETATLSSRHGKFYTLYYFATGSMVGGLSAAIGGISTSDVTLPAITVTPE